MAVKYEGISFMGQAAGSPRFTIFEHTRDLVIDSNSLLFWPPKLITCKVSMSDGNLLINLNLNFNIENLKIAT